MTKITKGYLWLMGLFLVLIGNTHKALASYWGQNQGGFGNVFGKIYDFAVGVAGIIFIIMFLIGGIQYLTAAGNAESSEKAKKLLITAVIGMVIVIIAYVAGSWVLSQIGGTMQI